MKYLIMSIVHKIRYRKTRKFIATIARDEKGRWLTNESGSFVLKTDDPKTIADAIERNKKRDERTSELIQILKSERTCKCGGDGMCGCTEGSKMRHPAANGGKLPLQQAEELEKKKKKPTPKKK
jgi:hypothetical protein